MDDREHLIQEIRRRVEWLSKTDEVSDDRKIAIARMALEILETFDEGEGHS